ncbi:hypothetical protein I6N95_15380 [Vagococcus sp. BWB3-3]|uniref:Uncharacterized protein n=1 Tax=Vagococcus allomyrinae TaxID=2794353 RepID=A0A940SWQ4_9ENTE|nr:hypothetical protein [Vagococcus allomyrinae]MBP1042401.1 hypothetical protein [Vagococcus allomyrinae]
MKYKNIEETIANIKLRPKMFIEELKLKNLYFLLGGYIGCALTTGISTEIDEVFKKDFSQWTKEWLGLNVAMDFSNDCLSWYKMYQKASETEEEALELFFKSSQEFFVDFHNNKL